MKVLISKYEILRITRDEYPNFDECPLLVEVVVFEKPSKLITNLRMEKHGIIKSTKRIIVK